MTKLNLGCGLVTPADWINIDGSWKALTAKSPFFKILLGLTGEKALSVWPSNVRVHDLRKGLPFAGGSVDVVYASHILEHFYTDEALVLLKECKRVLRPGGICRVVVPDLRGMAAKYFRSEIAADGFVDGLNLRPRQRPKDSLLKRLYYFFQGEPHFHKWMYDEASLKRLMDSAGFSSVAIKGLRDSAIADIDLVEFPDRVGVAVGIVAEAYA